MKTFYFQNLAKHCLFLIFWWLWIHHWFQGNDTTVNSNKSTEISIIPVRKKILSLNTYLVLGLVPSLLHEISNLVFTIYLWVRDYPCHIFIYYFFQSKNIQIFYTQETIICTGCTYLHDLDIFLHSFYYFLMDTVL